MKRFAGKKLPSKRILKVFLILLLAVVMSVFLLLPHISSIGRDYNVNVDEQGDVEYEGPVKDLIEKAEREGWYDEKLTVFILCMSGGNASFMAGEEWILVGWCPKRGEIFTESGTYEAGGMTIEVPYAPYLKFKIDGNNWCTKGFIYGGGGRVSFYATRGYTS